MPTAATSVAAVALVVAVAFVVIPSEDHGPGRAVQTLEGAPNASAFSAVWAFEDAPVLVRGGAADYDAPADHASLAARHGDVRVRAGASGRVGPGRRYATLPLREFLARGGADAVVFDLSLIHI